MKAYKIRDLDNFTGDAALYRVEPPMRGWTDEDGPFSLVVVSATNVPYSGPETYIFGATDGADADDFEGCVIADWCELDGSFRGALDHERALLNAGYVVRS